MSNSSDTATLVADRLDSHLALRRQLTERIYRELMMELHRRNIATIDDIHDEARQRAGEALPELRTDPNEAERDRWDQHERELVEQITREYVIREFTPGDIDDLVNLTMKREEVRNLENVANMANVSFKELRAKINRFCQLPLGETKLAPAEVIGTRVALIRHFLSDQLEFIGVAKNHLTIRDFDDITASMIGGDEGMGRIGGKAGGMVLAHRILQEADAGKTDPYLPIAMPDSYFLRHDVIEDFLRLNRLDDYQMQKYKPMDDVTREYPLIRGVFRNGDFPLKIVHELRRILKEIGHHPLIVRSSSLLEDRFGTAFCGKYASYFLPNQGSLEDRLRSLMGAVAEVYASILAPDPIIYRREHNLIDYVEGMAVLIQKVVGQRIGDFFLPLFAGVAFSRNEYRWSPRIKREDGLLRIVMGLGTRAVDRSGPDYPRMVALGAPTLRTESTVDEIRRCSQQTLDVIDLKANRLRSVRLQEILAQGEPFPMLDRLVSIYRDGDLYAPAGLIVDEDPDKLHITFDKLLRDARFVNRAREILQRLEDVYQVPVDVEFACDGERFWILQCRTQSTLLDCAPVRIPTDVADENVLFDAHRYVRTCELKDIEYIVYVDPAKYDAVPKRERRFEIARAIGRINRALKPKSFALVGPGRWGTNDIRLGVPVRYADINRCCILIEVARKKNGFAPEVSFGTHFFQDLVEADIQYLALYPDEPENRFNDAFLAQAPNVLSTIVPDDAEFEENIHVIHIPAVTGGKKLTIAMDGDSDQALAYLA